MIKYKTKNEIEIMSVGGKKLREVVKKLRSQIKAGIRTDEIDRLAESLIVKEGGEPSFKRVKGYNWSTCLSVNEQIVHTPPSDRMLKNGDILTLDIGLYYRGFNTDFSDTFAIGKVDATKKKFLDIGRTTLAKAIKEVKLNERLGLVSKTIQESIENEGYSIVKELTGHGVGNDLHEDPIVPGYLDRPLKKTPLIKPGLVIAVEVIYSLGKEKMIEEPGSEWSIITADRSLSACFEHTVAVTHTDTLILT